MVSKYEGILSSESFESESIWLVLHPPMDCGSRCAKDGGTSCCLEVEAESQGKVLPGVRFSSSGLATVESRRGLEFGTQRAVKESPGTVGKGPSCGRCCSICEVKTSKVIATWLESGEP